jgi:hypothetical protein
MVPVMKAQKGGPEETARALPAATTFLRAPTKTRACIGPTATEIGIETGIERVASQIMDTTTEAVIDTNPLGVGMRYLDHVILYYTPIYRSTNVEY